MGGNHNDLAVQRVSGVPNLIFDLISLLHNKLEGVAAIELYLADAEAARNDRAREIFLQSRTMDLAIIQQVRRMLRDELETSIADADANTRFVLTDRGGDLTPVQEPETVDLESDASFPASDPPSFSGTTASD